MGKGDSAMTAHRTAACRFRCTEPASVLTQTIRTIAMTHVALRPAMGRRAPPVPAAHINAQVRTMLNAAALEPSTHGRDNLGEITLDNRVECTSAVPVGEVIRHGCCSPSNICAFFDALLSENSEDSHRPRSLPDF